MLNDPWWADKYWEKAAGIKEPYFRAMTVGFWGLALWDRGERKRGKLKAEEAVRGLTVKSTEAYIVRGDICLQMATRDPEWFARAIDEYIKIPADDDRHRIYLAAAEQAERESGRSEAGAP